MRAIVLRPARLARTSVYTSSPRPTSQTIIQTHLAPGSSLRALPAEGASPFETRVQPVAVTAGTSAEAPAARRDHPLLATHQLETREAREVGLCVFLCRLLLAEGTLQCGDLGLQEINALPRVAKEGPGDPSRSGGRYRYRGWVIGWVILITQPLTTCGRSGRAPTCSRSELNANNCGMCRPVELVSHVGIEINTTPEQIDPLPRRERGHLQRFP